MKTNKMKKETRMVFLLCIIIIVLLVISAGVIWYTRGTAADGRYANIYQNNRLIRTIDLSKVEESYTFTVYGDKGEENTIEVRPSEIAMVSANCPDHLCVNMGAIHNGAMPITCLPNHVVIEITAEPEGDDMDGVAY